MSGLPGIAGYTLPTAAELPANRVGWRPHPDRAMLLVHDMQGHFTGPFPAGPDPLGAAIRQLVAVRAACRAVGVPVIYTAQPGGQSTAERGLQLDMWGAGVPAGPAAAIVPELAPEPDDIVLTKWRYSAFHRTELAGTFDRLGRDQIIITGIYAHIGVSATACDAFMRDIQPFVVADAVADFSREHHLAALRQVADRYGVVLDTHQALAAIHPAGIGTQPIHH